SIFINDTGGGNLLQLQTSGTDKFVVDNSGNLLTSSTQRLSAAGALSNITGYSQSSGTNSTTSTTATGNIFSLSDTSLTTGTLMSITGTNTPTTDVSINPINFALTNAQSTVNNTH